MKSIWLDMRAWYNNSMDQKTLQTKLNRGGTVRLNKGVYKFSELKVPKGTTLEGVGRVVFDGSRTPSKWTVSGSTKWTEYTPIPVRDGHGIAFTKGQNLTNSLGKYADQAWSGSTPLKRVSGTPGKGEFSVKSGKLYVHKSAKNVKVSDARVFGNVEGTLLNVIVRRYSPTAADDAAVRVRGGTIENSSIRHCSYVAVSMTGTNPRLKKVEIKFAGWMGIAARLASDLVIRECVITKINPYKRFSTSPQSGALKTSRVKKIKVSKTTVSETNGHGLWFDQSCTDVQVSNNKVKASGHAVFFEISHGLVCRNNELTGGSHAVKIAGSSGVKVYKNVLSAPKQIIGVYVDSRSILGCADPSKPKCKGAYSSDRLSKADYDKRVTWLTRVERLDSNTFKPSSAQKLIIGTKNGDARSTKAEMFPNGYTL